MATLDEFDFEIRYIKGKENKVVDSLSRWVQVNHVATMSSYGIDLHDRILQLGQKYVRYMDIVYTLEQRIGTSTCDSRGIGILDDIGKAIVDSIGTGIGDSRGTSTGISEGAQDMDYFLTTDGLVRFRDVI